MVSRASWSRYKKTVTNFIDLDSGKQPFLWLKKFDQMLAYGEDSGEKYQPIQLEALIQYNYIKTWPTMGISVSGEVDTTDVVLYISFKLLKSNQYINQYGYWDFNWADDRFILNGQVYKPQGDSQVAQAHEMALLFRVILRRTNDEESNTLLNSYVTDEFIKATVKGPMIFKSQGKSVKDIMGKIL